MQRHLQSFLFSCAAALCVTANTAAADVEVVATIKPVHSLVSAVMAGAGTPHLIVDGAASPHSYSLRPSDAQALQDAEVVFWIGEEFEAFLQAPLRTLAPDARIVALASAPGLLLLPYRSGDADSEHGEDRHGHDGSHDHEQKATNDMHVWLDPSNSIAMVEAITAALTMADAGNARLYAQNAEAVKLALNELDDELSGSLAGVAEVPFIVFHDAYQYLEARYGLRAAGFVTVDPERPPGVEGLRRIQETIRSSGAVCAFGEPQFSSTILETVIEGTDTRLGALDPMGAGIKPGAEHYFELMRKNAEALSGCLSGSD